MFLTALLLILASLFRPGDGLYIWVFDPGAEDEGGLSNCIFARGLL